MDLPSSRRSKLIIALALLTAIYWLGMFVGTHLPVTPDPNETHSSFDKVQHLSAFAGLALLLCLAGAAWGVATQRLVALVLGLIAIYGMFDELTQALVPNREPDLRDWLANMLGAGLGIAVFLCSTSLIRPRGAAAKP